MLNDLGYSSIVQVLESWELARQKFGSVEEVGSKIMLNLLDKAPDLKAVYGFNKDDNLEVNAKLRVRAMMHGTAMFKFLDSVLNLLGPDTDMIVVIIAGLGKRHQKYGVKKEHFPLLGIAIRESLANILKDKWNCFLESAWVEVFREVSDAIMLEMD
jgi:hemoglobin-like flavoprotein